MGEVHEERLRVRRALLSVSDKTGIVELARELVDRGAEILSTGGTARALSAAEVPIVRVGEFTGSPEILDGRVKTLHPKIHAGILARRDDPAHMATMAEHEIPPIDLVVVNLYPFRETIADPSVALADAIEQIDIGGPCMVRAAAKNFGGVGIVTNPEQYGRVIAEMREGGLHLDTRRELAREAFATTASYDGAIHAYLAGDRDFPDTLVRTYRKAGELRYGENPHQGAARYEDVDAGARSPFAVSGVLSGRQVAGSELSYNNWLDLEAAATACRELDPPAAVVIKHGNPCGAAEAETLEQAAAAAFRGDPEAAFGGIVGLGARVDAETARELTRKGRFLEAVVAPSFDPSALEILTGRSGWGERLRLVEAELSRPPRWVERPLEGGVLLQESDRSLFDSADLRTVSQTPTTEESMASLRFAFRVVKHVKSNAIVLARGREIVGVGAGQMSRVESVRIALRKAGERARGAVLASDAFFPFRDAVDEVAAAGIAGIIQPGGSKKDAEVIEAANEAGIALVFTGMRHFRH